MPDKRSENQETEEQLTQESVFVWMHGVLGKNLKFQRFSKFSKILSNQRLELGANQGSCVYGRFNVEEKNIHGSAIG